MGFPRRSGSQVRFLPGALPPRSEHKSISTAGTEQAEWSTNGPLSNDHVRQAGRALLVIADVLWTSTIAVLLSVAYAVTGVGVYFGIGDDGDRPNLATAWLIGYLTVGVIALCVWCVRVSTRWAR